MPRVVCKLCIGRPSVRFPVDLAFSLSDYFGVPGLSSFLGELISLAGLLIRPPGTSGAEEQSDSQCL